jgi:hypothetical protein
MKTMKNLFGLKSISTLVIAFVFILASCSKNDEQPLVNENSENVNTESAEDSYHSDADDLANSAALQPDAILAGRTEGWNDNRLCAGAKITLQKRTTTNSDTLTIDFGATGCTDSKGNVRTGKITLIFTAGKRLFPQFSHTITFSDFKINGVKIEGTRTITNVSPNLVDGDITFRVELVGGKLTFKDGSTATRQTTHFRQWFRNGTPLDFGDDQQKILATYNGTNSTASGTNRKGFAYEMQVTKDIVYKNSCLAEKIFVPVSGTKTLAVTKGTNAAQIIVDYGDGACDKTVTITINGKTETVTVKRDDNG